MVLLVLGHFARVLMWSTARKATRMHDDYGYAGYEDTDEYTDIDTDEFGMPIDPDSIYDIDRERDWDLA